MKTVRANPYRAVRQLERQLFRGVPERPEPMWQRDGHNSVSDRLTGRALVADRLAYVSLEGSELIGTTTYNRKTGKVTHKRAKSASAKSPKP